MTGTSEPTNDLAGSKASAPRVMWLRGASWLSGGTIASLGASAAAGILIARFLGPARLGVYAAVTVAASLIGMLSTFGLNMHLVTVLRNDDTDADSYARVLHLALALSLVATVTGELVAWFAFSVRMRGPLMIDLGEVFFAPFLLRQVVLQVRGHQRASVSAQMLNRAVWLLTVVLIIAIGPHNSLIWLMLGRVVVLGIQEAALALLAPFPVNRSRLRFFDIRDSFRDLRETVPVALASIFGTGYNRLDQLLLTAIRGVGATGIYAGGVRLAELPGALPGIVQNVSFPTLVQHYQAGEEPSLSRSLHDALLLTIIPGGLAVAFLAGLGRPLVVLVLGQRFASAAAIVLILAIADWARLPATVYTSLALATGRRRALVFGTGTGFAVNIVLNLTLIPLLGADGAAFASLGGYWTAALLTAIIASRTAGSLDPSYRLTLRLGAAAAVPTVLGHVAGLALPSNIALVAATYVLAVGVLLPGVERRRLVVVGRRHIGKAASAIRRQV